LLPQPFLATDDGENRGRIQPLSPRPISSAVATITVGVGYSHAQSLVIKILDEQSLQPDERAEYLEKSLRLIGYDAVACAGTSFEPQVGQQRGSVRGVRPLIIWQFWAASVRVKAAELSRKTETRSDPAPLGPRRD
jgi:hypothetical protein